MAERIVIRGEPEPPPTYCTPGRDDGRDPLFDLLAWFLLFIALLIVCIAAGAASVGVW